MSEHPVETIKMPLQVVDYLVANLSGNEVKLFLFIWRWTLGVSASVTNITHDDLSVLCSLNRSSITPVANRLVEKKLIIANRKPGQPSKYAINKDTRLFMEAMKAKTAKQRRFLVNAGE